MYQKFTKHGKVPRILQISMVILTIDTIDYLPVTSKGNRWALPAIYLHTSYVFPVPMKERSVENVIQACISDILAHKGGGAAVHSNN